ncbi:MAG: hypothetical protein FJW20_21590 [Acidimicrobiia bacterium]|nr:hypothetical protein [Acidimicrobiia bacterium]
MSKGLCFKRRKSISKKPDTPTPAGFQVHKGENMELAMEEKAVRGQSETGRHMANFLEAVKSRRYQDLRCDVATAARAADLWHMANIS